MRALCTMVLAIVALVFVIVPPAGAKPEPQPNQQTSVTLITGDRVLVGDGRSGPALRPAPGREQIPVTSFRDNGHLFVVPADAARLIASGRVDRRLFDVSLLIEYGYDDASRSSLPLIVRHGRQPAKLAAGTVTRELPGINGAAVTTQKANTAGVWDAVNSAAVNTVWLDGKHKASLDRSVPRIGAPAAWAAGFTGTGVKIAVLDTGVDQTHPDLASQEIAERNFTDSADNVDRVGHGTHVASTTAGTGTKYRGVAPGAKVLDGKVLNDNGSGLDSWVIAGLEWAADQGAKVINLSLGHSDAPGIDPVEEAVNTLSAQRGVLIVAASGNFGLPGEVGSPGTADAALSVGAVERDDAVAFFSGRGPRKGDGAIKPDITAPGVGIAAARAAHGFLGDPVEPGYVAMSGTSMATPHVAGAAALLAQAHPDWTGRELKAALMGSAKPATGFTPFEQGAGRVDVAKAIGQTITTEPASLSLGTAAWPHDDDQPVVKPITYRNTGPAEVTLDLSIEANSGVFSLSQNRLTVPAGGESTLTLTADTRVSTADGQQTAAIIASAGQQSARTPVAINKEVESYDLTVNYRGRDGNPTSNYASLIAGMDSLYSDFLFDPDGSITLRLPAGRYAMQTWITTDGLHDVLSYPALALTRNTTLDLDARLAKPIKINRPDPAAAPILTDVGYGVHQPNGRPYYYAVAFGDPDRVSVAQLGPSLPAEQLTAWVNTQWDAVQAFYGLAWFQRGSVPTGFTRGVNKRDLAEVRAELGAVTPGRSGVRLAFPAPAGGFDPSFGGDLTFAELLPVSLPGQRVEFYNADGTAWATELWQVGPNGIFDQESGVRSPSHAYRAGQSYRERFNHAVFGPAFPRTHYASPGVTRTGDWITANIPMFSDSSGNAGHSLVDSASTRLDRDGVPVGEFPGAGGGSFQVPAADGSYRLTVESTRPAIFDVSTRVSAAWTFRSRHVDGTVTERLPLSAIRFAPRLDQNNAAPAGQPFLVPVSLQRPDGSLGRAPRLTVSVSYDEGRTWSPATVIGNLAVLLHHPAGADSVSLKASAADREGNTVEQTIIRAYELAR